MWEEQVRHAQPRLLQAMPPASGAKQMRPSAKRVSRWRFRNRRGLVSAWRRLLRLCMWRCELKVMSVTDTVSNLPGGRNCSAAMTGESSVREVDSRGGRATASVPQAGREGAIAVFKLVIIPSDRLVTPDAARACIS